MNGGPRRVFRGAGEDLGAACHRLEWPQLNVQHLECLITGIGTGAAGAALPTGLPQAAAGEEQTVHMATLLQSQ